METATLGQIRNILELLEEIPQEQVQSVLSSGLLNDLFSANVAEVNREEFRGVCGLTLLPPSLLDAVETAVHKESPQGEFGIWKTIRLGTGLKTANGFWEAIKNAGMKISDLTKDMFLNPEFKIADKEQEVDLVVASVAELGSKNGARTEQIYGRAEEIGMELCPPEVGPQLRLQLPDQSQRECILVAMKPIHRSGGDSSVFRVECAGSELWLRNSDCSPGSFWHADVRWVFIRPRK